MPNALKQSILNASPYSIDIKDKLRVQGDPPIYELHSQHQVHRYGTLIEHYAQELAVDPDLVKAIMYMETTHGYYDVIPAWFDKNKSILPMNIHSEYWQQLGFSREELKDPERNIIAGIKIIKGIQDRLQNPTVRKIATLYNNTGAGRVSEYGVRVERIYLERAFAHRPDQDLPPQRMSYALGETFPTQVSAKSSDTSALCQRHRRAYQAVQTRHQLTESAAPEAEIETPCLK